MAQDPNYLAAKAARQDYRIGSDAPPTPYKAIPTSTSPTNLTNLIGAANALPPGRPTKASAEHKK